VKNNKSTKISLLIGVVLLFNVSVLTPMAIGYNYETAGIESSGMDCEFDDLFTCGTISNGSELLTISRETISNSLVELEKGISLQKVIHEPLGHPWSMESHDIHHTGRSLYTTSNNPGDEIWRFWTDSWAMSSPAIDDDGTIYFGSDDFYAVYPNGTLKWMYKTGIRIESCPAIDENGVIYIGDMDSSPNYLWAFYPNGTLKWRFRTGHHISSSPVIGKDGIIYFGCWNKNIYALLPNGTLRWKHKTNHVVLSSPAIGDNGTIYCGSHDKHLYALFPNGTLKWKFKTGDWVRGNPSIADDGTIYFPSYDDHLYALYPNGTLKWKFKTEFGASGSPAIGTDGTIYVGTNKLYAIYPNGTKKWSFDLGTDRYVGDSSPAISSDGTIYIGVNIGNGKSGELIAINPDGSERWRSGNICNEAVSSSPAIGEDGTVYICSASDEETRPGAVTGVGYLHAFNTFDPNAPDAPIINGSSTGKPGEQYEYTFTSTDPNGDDVYYYVALGVYRVENMIGPYKSGEKVSINHTWEEKGTYIIKARAIDPDNHWGEWSELEVTIPKSKNIGYLEWLEKFPRMNKELYDLNVNLKSYYLG
jgi:outer membrane protein assembly factor BamB